MSPIERTRRKARRRGRADAGRAARQSEMAGVLRSLGLWDVFRRTLPGRLQEWFLYLRSPRPRVVPADRVRADPRVEHLCRQLQSVLGGATFACPRLGADFPVERFFARVKPLCDTLVGVARSPGYGGHPFVEAARAVAGAAGGLDAGAWAAEAACAAVGFALLPHDRVDARVHAVALGGERTAGGWGLRLAVDAVVPERIEVDLDGARRAVTRVPVATVNGRHWATWPPAVAGLPAGGEPLPVYVQGHALRAAVGRLEAGPDDAWAVHQHLCRSLAGPVVARRDGPDCLVEFRAGDARLGYLACRVVGRVVVARTFLFLTMDGTPEGEALRRLRLGRADKAYLGLDRLGTFMTTDLAADPAVARLLGGCGCDRLLALAGAAPDPGQAALVRRYLGLGGG